MLVATNSSTSSANAKLVVNGASAVISSNGQSGKFTICYQGIVSAGATLNININQIDTCYIGAEVTIQADYGDFNAVGSYKKAYSVGANISSTSLFGSSNTVIYNLGSTSTAFNVQALTKPNNSTMVIPITNTQAVAIAIYLTVEIYGNIINIGSVTFS